MKDADEYTPWLRYMPNGAAIERVSTDNTFISLLASKNGTEIIHHTLAEGCPWALTPQDGWDELEAVLVLSGSLRYLIGKTETILRPGDLLSAEPVRELIIFTALEETNFIYISSNCVFHAYSKETREFERLAVEIEEKDGYTAAHCSRISSHSLLIGECLSLSSTELFSLNFGAFFHDIGKIHIPNEILLKPGKLSEEEFDIIKQHTIIGKNLLKVSSLPYLASGAIVAEQHHERFDGSGYPYGLKGDQISILAAIVAVVDSFDAMTSNRPYQPAKSKSAAIQEIRHLSGTLYHPIVVKAFLKVVDQFQ